MAFAGSLSAFALSSLTCWAMLRLGPRLGLVDQPDGDLKSHSQPAVPLGGVAVMFGLHAGLSIAGEPAAPLMAATAIVWLLGLVDDIQTLTPSVRLIGAAGAGLILATLSSDIVGLPQVIFWVAATVIVVNAINLWDGLDGLVATTSIMTMIGLLASGLADSLSVVAYVVPAAAVGGFFVWNWPPARLFLGDNGAYVVAVVLVWLSSRTGGEIDVGVVALSMIGLPVLDLVATVVRRLATRSSLSAGDRRHSYDLLHLRGASPRQVIGAVAIAQSLWIGSILLVLVLSTVRWAFITAVALGLAATTGLVLWMRDAYSDGETTERVIYGDTHGD